MSIIVLSSSQVVVKGLEQTKQKPKSVYSGSYVFNHVIAGEQLDLWPNGRYMLRESSDAIIPDDRTMEREKSYGAFAVRDGFIVLVPKDSKRRKRLLTKPLRMLPIRWGERLYMVKESRVLQFCEAIKHQEEPRKPQAQSFFLLKLGDDKKPATGMPSLPSKWRSYLETVKPTPKSPDVPQPLQTD